MKKKGILLVLCTIAMSGVDLTLILEMLRQNSERMKEIGHALIGFGRFLLNCSGRMDFYILILGDNMVAESEKKLWKRPLPSLRPLS